MIISSGSIEPRLINDYEILFTNGAGWTLSLDPAAGDNISIGDTEISVFIKGRPSPGDMGFITPDENQTIFKSNILVIIHRARLAIPPTPEQRNQVQELIQSKVGKTIH